MDDKKKIKPFKDENGFDVCEVEEDNMSSAEDELGLAVLSLNRLKSESRKMQEEWSCVEEERDKMKAEIEMLQQRLAQQDPMLSDRAHEIESKGKRLENGNISHQEPVAQIVLLEAEMLQQEQLAADANARAIARDSQIEQLRSQVQDLETYIEGRKEQWGKLNVELDDYRNALIGMEKTIKSREVDIQEREDDKGAMARRIIELEQQLAELDGRRAERESMNQQLQSTIDERGQQIDGLAAELAQEKAAVEPLRARDAEQNMRIDSLLADAGRQRERTVHLEASRAEDRASGDVLRAKRDALRKKLSDSERFLQQERIRVDSLEAANTDSQSDLDEANAKLAEMVRKLTAGQKGFGELEQKYDTHQAESVELWAELKQARESLADVKKRLLEREAKVSELTVESNVFTKEIVTLRDVLIAKNGLIAQLEGELPSLNDPDAPDALDIDEFAVKLEKPVASDNVRENGAGQQATGGNGVTRLMVAMTGDEMMKFPIYKESMTIGRSTDNDIQLCWKYISRNHARIVCGNAGGATIEDLGSKNGIFVNNKPVDSIELHNGDSVEIGEVQFEYVELEGQSATAAHT